MAKNLKYVAQSDFRGGICQEPENASRNQVIDALNVWAPEGLCAQRPGYSGVSSFGAAYAVTDTPSGRYYEVENPSGVFAETAHGAGTVSLSSLPVGAKWYFGFSSTPPSDAGLLYLTVDTANTAATYALYEYWNGERWRRLAVVEATIQVDGRAQKHLEQGGGNLPLLFAPPDDWTTTAVNSRTLYWLRATIMGATTSAGTDLNAAGTAAFYSADRCAGQAIVDLSNTRLYLTLADYAAAARTKLIVSSGVRYGPITPSQTIVETTLPIPSSSSPPTFAAIAEFNRVYTAYSGNVIETVLSVAQAGLGTTAAGNFAAVNSSPELVGTIGNIKSPYHPDYVPQLGSFPKASLVAVASGVVFYAGIAEEPFTVRWTGPIIDGAYNIFPEDSFEVLSRDDNSPITALAVLNEHLVVFKHNSVWLMVPGPLNDLELPTFVPTKVVSGVGCVAPGSVQAVRGRLIFLGEDGVYAFDGTPNIQKVSENVDDKLAEVNRGYRGRATAVNWSAQNAYLLSVPMAGSTTNNFVFCYDYAHAQADETGRPVGAWWFWDNIEANTWLLDTGVSDEQILYFGDQYGRIFQMIGDTDNGAIITSRVKTHRFRVGGSGVLREARIVAYQDPNDLQVTVTSEDATDSARALNLASSSEGKFGDTTDQDVDYFYTENPLADGTKTLLQTNAQDRQITIRVTDENVSVTAATITVTGVSPDGDTQTDVLTIAAATDTRTLVSTNIYRTVSSIVVSGVAGAAAGDLLEVGLAPTTPEWVPSQRRERRLDYRQSGRWFQVEVENDTKAVPMKLERIELGIQPIGRR